MPFVGYQCWQPERIGEVINKEALTTDDADFLATHVPMRRITYEKSSQHIRETSEAGLLDELMRAGTANEHVFTVVKGIPGTGKSHLIRWLELEYRLKHPTDAVLLIARANSSLRATLQQIIDSRVFQRGTLPEPLMRLQEAVTILSESALSDKLLNGLQVATHALDWEHVQQRLPGLAPRIKPKKVEAFLLDQHVRAALKASNGPIERIKTFLASGTGSSMGVDSIPGFEAADFEFGIEFLKRLDREGAYHEVKEFCKDLNLPLRVEMRESLARYLDFTLRQYAIRDATQLAAGDLQVMFQDLRRHLHAQGKSLALFIEDITAFTGLDEGLIEVLINSHRAGGGQLCRLTSVVGATDTYYRDRFPDNIKERVTHILTLNSQDGRDQSELMQDANTRAEFAARYLNAMRVTQSQVREWAERGAHENGLPNACAECPFQPDCHEAFGAVQLQDARGRPTNTPIGLYPFNQRALDTAYQFLKDTVSRTPRTFLNDLLAYILTSHGDLITAGKFPPPSREFLNDVVIPTFDPPAHQRRVEEQGGGDAERLETLFRFWGNRSVASHEENHTRFVGGLGPTVFRAFKLKTITGVAGEPPVPEPGVTTPPPPPPKREEPKEYLKQIETWANGGMLFGYDKFVDWIADLFRAFIDWQVHGISASQVKEYLTGSRFLIEGQSKGVQAGRLHFTFKRSSDLRYVLGALAELNDSTLTLQPAQYGEHLTTLSIWARQHESDIVAFVREPTKTATAPDLLRQILLKDAVLLSCLAGELDSAAANGSSELYLQVIASCANSTKDKWKSTLEQLSNTHPADWIKLMRGLQGTVHTCRTELLQLLNRPQGASTNVRYLDAASALPLLADFNDKNWSLEPLPAEPETNDEIWQNALRVYQTLQSGFASTWKKADSDLEEDAKRLNSYLGEASAQDAYVAMKKALDQLRQTRELPAQLVRPFDPSPDNPYVPARLEALKDQLNKHFKLGTQRERIASLSANLMIWRRDVMLWLDYFELFERAAHEHNERLKRETNTLRGRSDADEQLRRTRTLYAKTLKLLAPFSEVET